MVGYLLEQQVGDYPILEEARWNMGQHGANDLPIWVSYMRTFYYCSQQSVKGSFTMLQELCSEIYFLIKVVY